MQRIHPTAIVSSEAEIGEDVEIGPQCIVQGKVRLDRGVRLIAQVYLQGPLRIGENTRVYPGAAIGMDPQDVKFKEGDITAGVVIGARSIIREQVTIHAATKPDIPTRVGDGVFMMVGSHMGHDTSIGNNVIMVNGSGLAGHSQVGDNATLSGLAIVHQFCRVGRFAFMSGRSGITMDVPPFCILAERNGLVGINVVGLRRAGMPREQITAIRAAFRDVFRPILTRPEMVEILEERGRECPPVAEMAEFVRTTKRGICRAMRRRSAEVLEPSEVD
jgi:UDP-N-acetylglucosamine acyltransferase